MRQRAALEELAIRNARVDLFSFLQWCWWMPQKLVHGTHTIKIANRLTRANEDLRRGISTYLMFSVPFRHGKSDIVSRALPAWFLGRNQDIEPSVIMSGYGHSLVTGFSKDTKDIMAERPYQMLYPGVLPARGSNRVDEWRVEGSVSKVVAQGLEGSLTGKGANLLVLDDYCRKRSEAVSKAFRDKTWDSFRNNFFTRQNSPAAIVIVCATPWHVDDVRGRIRREAAENPHFPQFEELSFPARIPGQYEYLMPELYPPSWYDAQRAVLGKQAAALLDCEPIHEGGNRFDTSKVVIHHTLDGWPKGRETRAWDLASSDKERSSDNPDRTWGIKGHVKRIGLSHGVYMHEMWISDMVACRAEAPERNALIYTTARADGPGVPQYIESFGAYKDAYTTLKQMLQGMSSVVASRMPGDKSAKLAPLEPIFDAGNFHIYAPGCREWLDTWKAEFDAFPDGEHDDAPDATAVLYDSQASGGGSRMLV